jgi:transposase-like protein
MADLSEKKKREAIDALLEQPSVAEVARGLGIDAQTLHRLKKDPAFEAELRAAKRAHFRQQKARLRQGLPGAVMSVVHNMYHGAKPAACLQAALQVISLAEDANEFEESAAGVAQMERASQASQAEAMSPCPGARGRQRMTGHGAKFPRVKQQAITELLVQRSVAHAARAAGIGTQTLYRWLEEPEFIVAYSMAARAVFEPAMTLVQTRLSDAVTIVRRCSVDRAIPDATRLKAAQYIIEESKTNEVEELAARVAELEPANAGGKAPVTSKTIGRSLYQSLQRLKARLSPANWPDEFEYVHAVDGKAAGLSLVHPDGRHVWLQPPEGCQEGEAVEEVDGPVQDLKAA